MARYHTKVERSYSLVGTWTARCSCGWQAGGFATQREAGRARTTHEHWPSRFYGSDHTDKRDVLVELTQRDDDGFDAVVVVVEPDSA